MKATRLNEECKLYSLKELEQMEIVVFDLKTEQEFKVRGLGQTQDCSKFIVCI